MSKKGTLNTSFLNQKNYLTSILNRNIFLKIAVR